MARSPIEMMVDKACGFDPDVPRPAVTRTVVDRDTQALMNVGDAALAWLRQREKGNQDSRIEAERLLVQCTKELAATGW